MARLEGSVPTLDGDYFSEIYQRLWLQLANRCARQQAQSSRQQWERFALAFNQQVAGTAPFGPSAAKPADIGQVTDVMTRWEDAAVTLLPLQATGAYGGDNGGAAVQRFARRMQLIDTFLSPLLARDNPTGSGATSDAAGYDLHIVFRTNRGAESEGNQIIDWSLQSGTQVVHATDAAHTVRWTLGTPLTLTLRIAKNSPFVALSDITQPAMDTDGRTVSYRFSDPWSLMTMLQTLRVAEPGVGNDARAATLQLSFPMGAAPQPTGKNATAPTPSLDPIARAAAQRLARVFVQLQVTPAGKQNALPWPGAFPRQVPAWHGTAID